MVSSIFLLGFLGRLVPRNLIPENQWTLADTEQLQMMKGELMGFIIGFVIIMILIGRDRLMLSHRKLMLWIESSLMIRIHILMDTLQRILNRRDGDVSRLLIPIWLL